MIERRGISFLDGDFGHMPEVFSFRADGKWFMAERGKRYANTYEVLAFDEEGLRWLEGHESHIEKETT